MMNLILNEDVQRLADARSKREMAAALDDMPLWTLLVYRSTITKRLHIKGFSEAVAYVDAYADAVREPRDRGTWSDAVFDRIEGARLAMSEAVTIEDMQAEAEASQALETALSITDL